MSQRSRIVGLVIVGSCLCTAVQAQTLPESVLPKPDITSGSVGLKPAAADDQAPLKLDTTDYSAADRGHLTPRTTSTNFFQTTISDFKHLPSKDTLAWLSVGALAAGMSATVDHRVTSDFGGQAQLKSVFHSGSYIGDSRIQMAAAAMAFTAGRMSGNRKVAMVGGDLLRAQIIAVGLSSVTKVVAQRTRPDGTSLSFPSGHTATAFATATVLQRDLGWKVGIPAYAAAAFVGASRIEDMKHYLSDVAFGAALGIVAGRTVTVGRGEARFAIAPMATSGGGGVNFAWVGHK